MNGTSLLLGTARPSGGSFGALGAHLSPSSCTSMNGLGCYHGGGYVGLMTIQQRGILDCVMVSQVSIQRVDWITLEEMGITINICWKQTVRLHEPWPDLPKQFPHSHILAQHSSYNIAPCLFQEY